jgi:nucleoside 2-deoxyribosyltransferase
MRIYLASPLFTEAERAFNLTVASRLQAESHYVYLPQCETPEVDGPGRTTAIFRANLTALGNADAVVAICDGSQVDDGTAWEIGYAYGRNIPIYALRTDTRIVQRADERINLMILESLNELSPSVDQLLHTLRYVEKP